MWAATSVPRDRLKIADDSTLRWIDSPESVTNARRGFCVECGSGLFWDAPGRDTIAVAAGALDAPTGLRVHEEIWLDFAGDYYEH